MNPPSSSPNSNQQPPKADADGSTCLDEASRHQHHLNHFERATTFGIDQLNTSIAAFDNDADDTSGVDKASASTHSNDQQTTRATVGSTSSITEANSITSRDENLIKKRILSENKRAHVPPGTTFDDRLRQKLSSGQTANAQATATATKHHTNNIGENPIKKRILSENKRAHVPPGTTFDDRLRQKLSSGQTANAQATATATKHHTNNIGENLIKKRILSENKRDHVPPGTTFDDRLRQKLSSGQTANAQPLSNQHTNNDVYDVEKKRTATDTVVSGTTFDDRPTQKLSAGQTTNTQSEQTQTQASSRALPHIATRTDPELGEVIERHDDDPILEEGCASINEGEGENLAVDANTSETGVINASARCAEDAPISQNVQLSQRSRRTSIWDRLSTMRNVFRGGEVLVTAELVVENEGDVVEATPVSFMERKWKRIALVTIIGLLLGMAVMIPVLLAQNKKKTDADEKTIDPIIGTSDFMPASSNDSGYRMCMGGECPIGNLFTDALRWKAGADFAAMSSGRLRGPGWPAGKVRMSDISAAYPFENYLMCTGTMNGVSVLRLLNYSTASATFESSASASGGALLQLSGMKISYNTLLQGTGHGRLVSVDIWDADSQEYLPLQHGQMYNFVTTSWMCDQKNPFPSLFQTMGMKGEVPGSVDQSINVQSIVGEYLRSLDEPYNTTLRGSHVNDTEAFEPISFPTLDIVQERGHIRCGFGALTITSGGFLINLCRAVAAVLFGDPDKYVGVQVTYKNRFQQLHERFVDILLLGDTHTVEREVRERTTNVGFTFSAPYYYDGMSYFGNETFVECAEDEKRYDECADLKICVLEGSTDQEFVEIAFPVDVILVTYSPGEELEMLLEGKCNVIASIHSVLLDLLSGMENNSDKFVLGDKLMTKEPLAAVTQNNDQPFSDIVNWVIQALFHGEEKGITKDPEKCQSQVDYITHLSSLNFLNAVYCVGNYGEIVFNGTDTSIGMNSINGGDSGMLYAIPFGRLDRDDIGGSVSISTFTLLGAIKRAGSLNCGVVVLDGLESDINLTNTSKILGMSIDYCHALAAALFKGDYKAVNILQFSGSDTSFNALSNGAIDVLAGSKVELNRDIGLNAKHEGFHFSSAYYFGNESASDDLSVYSLATREGNALFSSFVNCVVLATIYAEEEGIAKEEYKRIPQISLFGNLFAWSLRDTISYSGSYNELYTKHFGEHNHTERGRNRLNDGDGPRIHSFPGLLGMSSIHDNS